jgi:hypothetical protein
MPHDDVALAEALRLKQRLGHIDVLQRDGWLDAAGALALREIAPWAPTTGFKYALDNCSALLEDAVRCGGKAGDDATAVVLAQVRARVRRDEQYVTHRPARRDTAPLPRPQRAVARARAPHGRRAGVRTASRGSPRSTGDDPEGSRLDLVARLPQAAAIYARAAWVERLACDYAAQGRADLFYIGIGIAERIEDWADMKAAA